MADDSKLLQEIRDNYTYCAEGWREIYKQGRKDVKYQTDPWDSKERGARSKPGQERPCVVFDELTQYLNQIANEGMLNKRAIKIDPEGNGASDEFARFRQARLRYIEHRSNAQSAYLAARWGAISRSFGFAGWETKYCDEESCDLELVTRRFPNPEAVLLDPAAKEIDCSDGMMAFVLDYIPIKRFKLREPNAKIQDFTADHAFEAPDWITPNHILVAEYWKVDLKHRTLMILGDNERTKFYKDDLPEGFKIEKVKPVDLEGEIVDSALRHPDGSQVLIIKQRETEIRKVVQYITNGIEILETNPWRGRWIPISPCFGREEFVDLGESGSKRVLLSAVRKVRDSVMSYCYARSSQLEEIGRLPKAIYAGYEGQFATATDWDKLNKVTDAYVEFAAKTEATGEAILPIPQRQTHEPAIQALEMFCEATRRSIQAGMGLTPLPTSAQRQNQKSGVALERIENQMSRGAYHFSYAYDRFLTHMGRIANDLLDKIEDTPRDVGTIGDDDKHEIVRLNQESTNSKGEKTNYSYGKGRYAVTVSAGPSFESEREEGKEFADTLANTPNLVAMALQGQGSAPKILASVIKLRNLGAIGDQMAEDIDPSLKDGEAEMPPEATAKLQQAAQQLQQMQAYMQKLQQALQELQAEKQGKVLDNQQRMEIAQLEEQTKIKLAEIKAQMEQSKLQMDQEFEKWKIRQDQEHERGMQSREQLHDVEMAGESPPAAQE